MSADETDVTVALPRDAQALVMFHGSGRITILRDDSWVERVNLYPPLSPIERAVIVARLRATADLYENDGAAS